MARKKKVEEHENHERWLVSYADFITLLFAFFVVMYSISSVNEGKYRVLSDSMSSAFRSSARSIAPIQVGELTRSPKSIAPVILEVANPVNIMPVVISREEIVVVPAEVAEEQASQRLQEIASDVSESLEDLMADDEILLKITPLWLEIEINSNFLFNSASADISSEAQEVLRKLALLLNEYPNRINVEGFTDNRPIRNSIYPSNWELSSARAAAVVRLFESTGVDPMRMAAVGYGEFKPTSNNDSEEGRASNRKVIVVVMADVQDENANNSLNDINLELFRQRISQ